jgi:hypothetical protein
MGVLPCGGIGIEVEQQETTMFFRKVKECQPASGAMFRQPVMIDHADLASEGNSVEQPDFHGRGEWIRWCSGP